MRPGVAVHALEPGVERRHRGRHELPQLFRRIGLDPPGAGLQLELERLAEQPAHVLLLRPLGRVGLVRDRPPGPGVDFRPCVLPPRRERQPAAGSAHPRELGRGALVVGSEDRAEDRRDGAELRIRVREVLAVPLVEPDLEPFGGGGLPRLRELVSGDVDPDDVGAGAGRAQGDAAGAAGNVEHALARLERECLHDAIVDRGKRLGDALVTRAAPGIGDGPGQRTEHTARMGDLFSDAADQHAREVAPLAQRLRPATLAEFVGQQHILGEGSALRRAIEQDRVHSSIFYGPPGSGKTTLARIVAASTGAAFEELSAVSATVKDVREVLARAKERLGTTGTRTILFLDEIHRFNKAQQDALLPGVESGLLTLIGATTENPYYEVNSALISRTQVYELETLTPEEMSLVVRRGLAEVGGEASDEVVELIAHRSGGDARTALNIVELANETADGAITAENVEDAARKPPLVYDKAGDAHYDFTSAFIKSMRGGDPDAAVYYLAAMLEGGEDARFIARRMIVLASEDIGNADPRALLVAVAAAQAVEHVGLPEARLNLAQAAIYLARAPKSNASYMALNRAAADVQERGAARPPKALRDGSYYGRRLGHGEGYVYPHSDPAGFETSYLPEELEGRRYYEPSGSGEESSDENAS
jgi:putative ATPase